MEWTWVSLRGLWDHFPCGVFDVLPWLIAPHEQCNLPICFSPGLPNIAWEGDLAFGSKVVLKCSNMLRDDLRQGIMKPGTVASWSIRKWNRVQPRNLLRTARPFSKQCGKNGGTPDFNLISVYYYLLRISQFTYIVIYIYVYIYNNVYIYICITI